MMKLHLLLGAILFTGTIMTIKNTYSEKNCFFVVAITKQITSLIIHDCDVNTIPLAIPCHTVLNFLMK